MNILPMPHRYYAILVGCNKLPPKMILCANHLSSIKNLINKEEILTVDDCIEPELDEDYNVKSYKLSNKEWSRLYAKDVMCSCGALYIVKSKKECDDVWKLMEEFEAIQI